MSTVFSKTMQFRLKIYWQKKFKVLKLEFDLTFAVLLDYKNEKSL